MVTLKCPFFWNGRLIREGARISLPAEVEERLLRAGNAVPTTESVSPPPSQSAPEAGKESREENTPEKSSPKSGRKQAEQVELTLGR